MPRTPPLPELQPMVDYLREQLEQRSWNRYQLCGELYGWNPNGSPHSTGAVYTICNGTKRPSTNLARRLLERTGIDLTPWAPEASMWRTPAAAAVAAYEAERLPALSVEPAPVPRRQGPPRLAMQITGSTGSLTFNLADAPAAEVLRAFQVLSAAGLIEEPHNATEQRD